MRMFLLLAGFFPKIPHLTSRLSYDTQLNYFQENNILTSRQRNYFKEAL